MGDRPKRERKPTHFFEYRDTPTESTAANVGNDSQSATRLRGTPKIKKEIGEPDRGTLGNRGRGRGRGRSTGCGSGRKRSQSGSDIHRRSVEGSPEIFLRSSDDSIDDVGAIIDDSDDPEFGESENIDPRLDRTVKFSSRKLPSLDSKQATDEDQIIERWYADPYERVNPDTVTYDQWRLRNLLNGLQNQGYGLANTKQMAAWLMKCNGHFAEFKTTTRKSRKRKHNNTVPESTPVNDDTRDDEDEDHEADDHVVEDSEQADNPTSVAYATFKAAMASQPTELDIGRTNARDTTSSESETCQITTPSRKEDTMKQQDEADDQEERDGDTPPSSGTSSQDQQLENLKRCLKVFTAVYGHEGPQGNPAKFEHDHFSRVSTVPVLKPKTGLRTQGHFELQEVLLPADDFAFLNGIRQLDALGKPVPAGQPEKSRRVFTEDPDFGAAHVPKSERATEADMKLYYAQFARLTAGVTKGLAKKGEIDSAKLADEEDPEFLIAARNHEHALTVIEQLQQTVFPWETSLTMQGRVPGRSKADSLRNGAFAIEERHVWKELRKRQEILAEGGEDAARLLEQEWEDARVEEIRELRRKESARARAKKREWIESNGFGGGGGVRKKVRFGSWIAET